MSDDDAAITTERSRADAWRIAMLVITALLGAAVVTALILTLRDANHQRDRALRLQTHSYEVMILASTLSGTIAHAEASLGRYVISADRGLGARYSEDWQVAGEQINRLDRATHDNPGQQTLIGDMRRAYRARGAELSVIALSTFYKKNPQALALYYKAREGASLAQIDRLLDTITAQERTLLARRTGAAMASVARSSGIASVLAAFGLMIVLGAVALGWLTVLAFGQRASARAEADSERYRSSELELAVAEAAAELRVQEGKLRQVQKMEAVGQLTGGIAHDFNNMLAVVLGGLELAKRQIRSDRHEAERHIDSATEGAHRAAALTRRLLAFSREDALRSEAIDSGALVAGMSELLDRTLGDGVTVEVRAGDAGWLIRADRHQLENALLNLAVNARDAMDGRGTLTIVTGIASLAEGDIGACAAGNYVSIAVTDNGCGMTPAVLERVFEPFFTTKPTGQGTGLGLSQVFGFVRQAGGEVALRSAPGEGTTVTLYLPRHIAADQAPAGSPVAGATVTEPTGDHMTLAILVVEDDPRVLAATIGALEELGHRPIPCDDPLAAPAVLDRVGRVDLIMSDVLMPGQTGPEMIARLAPRHPATAVLFVTGYAGDAGGEAEFGGHHVLRKPFTIAALDTAVRAATIAARAAAAHGIAAE